MRDESFNRAAEQMGRLSSLPFRLYKPPHLRRQAVATG